MWNPPVHENGAEAQDVAVHGTNLSVSNNQNVRKRIEITVNEISKQCTLEAVWNNNYLVEYHLVVCCFFLARPYSFTLFKVKCDLFLVCGGRAVTRSHAVFGRGEPNLSIFI